MKTNYEGQEFKSRQGSFDFYCDQAYEFLIQFRKNCRKGWKNLFFGKKEIKIQYQENFEFIRPILEWANWQPEKNHELFV